MAFRPVYLSLALCWLPGSVRAAELCSYTARMSAKDKLTQLDKPLMTSTSQASAPATDQRLSLLERPETARAMRTLENDKRLQLIFQQSFGLAQYAECAAMVADIEQGLAIGRYQLEAKQYVSYAGVAAGMAYVRQQLSSQGAERSVLEQAVRAAQQRPSGETSFF